MSSQVVHHPVDNALVLKQLHVLVVQVSKACCYLNFVLMKMKPLPFCGERIRVDEVVNDVQNADKT